jgi:DNA-binding CsgD family transcriptional regulator/tetratricopeptide (TPR) repeat protein
MTAAVQMETPRRRARAVWAAGDYPEVARRLIPELGSILAGAANEGRARTSLGTSLTMTGRLAEGLAELERRREIAERLDLPEDAARARINASFTLALTGRHEEALAAARVALEHAFGSGVEAAIGAAQAAVAANSLIALGEHEQAVELVAEWLLYATLRVGEVRLRTTRVQALVQLGRLDEAERSLARAHDVIGGLADMNHLVPLLLRESELALWAGEAERAIAATRRALDVIARADEQTLTGPALALAWRAAADAGGARDGAELERARAALDASHVAEWASTRAALTLADAERSRLDGGGPEPWARAAAELDAVPYVFDAAYARLRAAEALLAVHDREGAAAALGAARDTARRLGAGRLLAEADALARRGRLDEDDGARTPLPAGLTDRELQVLDLLEQGRTNREIAAALFISEKTASVHVSNILRKLGVANRGQAAAARRRLTA